MLTKTILLVWLLAGRGDIQFSYVLKYQSEAACQAQAKVIESKNGAAFQMYPINHATCVVDATPLLPENQTTRK